MEKEENTVIELILLAFIVKAEIEGEHCDRISIAFIVDPRQQTERNTS